MGLVFSQITPLLIVLHIILSYTKDKNQVFHHSYYCAFGINRVQLISQEMLHILKDWKLLFIMLNMYFSTLLFFNDITGITFIFFTSLYCIQNLFIIFCAIILFNAVCIQKSQILIFYFFQMILVYFNIPLILQQPIWTAISPFHSMFLAPIFAPHLLKFIFPVFIVYISVGYMIIKKIYRIWPI